MRNLVITILSVILVAAISYIFIAPVSTSLDPGNGLIKMKSLHSVQETADRFVSIIEDKGITLFMKINHSENAKKIAEELRPTQILIFGNPKLGTPLMRCGQSVGIDLPQKLLVWEDESGQVWLAYNHPKYLARRHNLTECDELIENIAKALDNFAKQAAGLDK
jgi:uncharacterized protein (DUF302 family)